MPVNSGVPSFNIERHLKVQSSARGMLRTWGLWLALFTIAGAEQLPIKSWTTADGLAHNHINRIRLDSRGYLWICTDEGLSRFDGYQFTNYTTAQGLPHRSLSNIIEARDGTYWLATDGGVCRFDPDGIPASYQSNSRVNHRPMFVIYRLGERAEANYVNSIAEDQDGALWCAASEGLFRLRRAGEQVKIEQVEIGLPRNEREGQHVSTVVVDGRGIVWAGAISGLYARWPDGRTQRFTTADGLPDNFVQTLLVDRDGSLWGGTRREGFCRMKSVPQPGQPITERCYSTRDGLAGNDVRQIFRAADGRLWLATVGGLSEMGGNRPAGWPTSKPFINYTAAEGLSGFEIYRMAEDNSGNLWLGTKDNGVMRMARAGFTTYTETDGFRPGFFPRAFGGKEGEICIENLNHADFSFQQFDGRLFKLVTPFFPGQITMIGNRQLLMHDRRLQALLPDDKGFHRLYTDARGDTWLTVNELEEFPSYRLDGASGNAIDLAQLSEIFKQAKPYTFCDDKFGQLWIGLQNRSGRRSGLLRYRQGGFTLFTTSDGVPKGQINTLHIDRLGRLWIGSDEGGLGRIDDPSAKHPHVVITTTAEGLSSDEITCLTEDELGHIYAGNNRGVDRLDPASGHIRHYTVADGLAPGAVLAAGRDQQGALWFVTAQAVSRIIPAPDEAATPLPIFISGVRVEGVQRMRSALGENAMPPLQLVAGENNISIDFISLDLSAGEKLRYQYRLAGADREWSPPSEQRTVNYASLSPGTYRFAVRAVNAQGVLSDRAATFNFTLPLPLWKRWWFILLLMTATGLAFFALYRYRVAQLLTLERMRTRIATDLHDDIGSNLSLIVGLSQVLRDQIGRRDPGMSERLSVIADASGRSMESMSDIIWAVNPKKDHLSDLSQKMRRFASDVFTSRDIAFTFTGPAPDQHARVDAETRREVFLIFKEAVNNIVRHSACSKASVTLEIERGKLLLAVSDNGCGFDPETAEPGNGLLSLKARAAKLGGALALTSAIGQGTSVTLTAALRRSEPPVRIHSGSERSKRIR